MSVPCYTGCHCRASDGPFVGFSRGFGWLFAVDGWGWGCGGFGFLLLRRVTSGFGV